jgi:hypothetical protein
LGSEANGFSDLAANRILNLGYQNFIGAERGRHSPDVANFQANRANVERRFAGQPLKGSSDL